MEIPLKDFCAKHGQARAAEIFQLTVPRISQMISGGVEAYVMLHSDGSPATGRVVTNYPREKGAA
jgi:hypothetical protein